jgi:acyl-CoA thioester hydrolase
LSAGVTEAAAPSYRFELSSEVRDYECDMHGIVNNAVYLNYLEHARRSFFRSRGYGFADITAQGWRLLMAEMSLKYLQSLVSGDRYTVRLAPSRAGGLLVFRGDIFRGDETLCLRSVAKIAVMKDGQLTAEAAFPDLFG